jgi:hypothetical protein
MAKVSDEAFKSSFIHRKADLEIDKPLGANRPT